MADASPSDAPAGPDASAGGPDAPGTRAPADRDDTETADPAAPQQPSSGKEARRLHPLTILQQVVTSLPALAVLLLPFLTTGGDLQAWSNLIPAVGYGLIALPLIVARYWRFRYWITDSEIVIRKGVFKTQHRSMPIERVQNVQVVRSLLPRLLGMAKVKVETAGSGSTEGTIEYVAPEEAERIRRAVRAFQRRGRPAARETEAGTESRPPTESLAAPESPAAPEEEILYAMPLGRVLLSGVFRFSLALIAFIAAGLQYTGFDEPSEIVGLFREGPLRSYADTVLASPYLATLFAVVLVCLLGWLTGIALNVNRYYGFRLWREGHDDEGRAKLHYRRGLLTVSEGTIPLEKVQAVVLRTNPLMRAFDWFILEVQTMGVEGSNHRTVVPFARHAEVVRLARRIRPLRLPEAFEPVSRLTIRRSTVRGTIMLAAAVGTLGLVGGLFTRGLFWHGAYWLALAWPLVPAWALARYRRLGYAFSPGGLLVRRGVLRQRTWLLPTERQQVFYTTASVFQRRLGLKTLYLDTAGASGLAAPEVVDLPASEADARLRELYDRFCAHFSENGRPAARG